MPTTRRSLIGAAALGSSIVLANVGLSSATAAQDSTPPPEPMGPPESIELAPGVTADSMVFVEGQEAPSLYRLHFDPGVIYDVAPGTSLELAYVESGNLTATLDVAITLGRVGETATEGEAIDANTGFTLEAGQYFVLQPGGAGEMRNSGEQIATISIAGLTPGGVSQPQATPAG
jgi:hypothetical protein